MPRNWYLLPSVIDNFPVNEHWTLLLLKSGEVKRVNSEARLHGVESQVCWLLVWGSWPSVCRTLVQSLRFLSGTKWANADKVLRRENLALSECSANVILVVYWSNPRDAGVMSISQFHQDGLGQPPSPAFCHTQLLSLYCVQAPCYRLWMSLSTRRTSFCSAVASSPTEKPDRHSERRSKSEGDIILGST
jgi:hypothetical protein